MKNAKKFFEELIKTEEAKTILAAMDKPETEEERISAYIEIAKKLGVELTANEINAYFESIQNSPSAELDDEELEQLVGGAGCEDCSFTFTQKENCMILDACDGKWQSYADYQCKTENVAGTKINETMWNRLNNEYRSICDAAMVSQKYREYSK